MTKVYITAIRLSGGKSVQHITHVWKGSNTTWSESDEKKSTSEMVDLIERQVHQAWVRDPDPAKRQEAQVMVVSPTGRAKYLRTKPDDDPNDNLLKLPQK